MNFKFPQFSATPLASIIPQVGIVFFSVFEILSTCYSGEQGGGELDGGYAEVGSQEKAKCRKSSPLSLLPGALLETYIFARFDLI